LLLCLAIKFGAVYILKRHFVVGGLVFELKGERVRRGILTKFDDTLSGFGSVFNKLLTN
jgi:hypothetical protein